MYWRAFWGRFLISRGCSHNPFFLKKHKAQHSISHPFSLKVVPLRGYGDINTGWVRNVPQKLRTYSKVKNVSWYVLSAQPPIWALNWRNIYLQNTSKRAAHALYSAWLSLAIILHNASHSGSQATHRHRELLTTSTEHATHGRHYSSQLAGRAI